jgi:hypothetical protein
MDSTMANLRQVPKLDFGISKKPAAGYITQNLPEV